MELDKMLIDTKEYQKEGINKSLQERFGVPPFSILDTKQGYWQDRKRLWLSLGIKSEIGRDAKTYNTQGWVDKKNIKGNAINMTGTSIFDPVLTELMYKWFCPSGGGILDPFAGGSVRGVVAAKLGYKYTGIELSEKQVIANKVQGKLLCKENVPTWHNGDSFFMDKYLPHDYNSDFIFSCPPYFDLEIYSKMESDLSNMTYDKFLYFYGKIIESAVKRLSNNRFACFVVGDLRDKRGYYRNFVSHTINYFERAGAKYYNEIILVNSCGSLPIRIGKQFNCSRKIGKQHQNVLVFYKGDISKIKENFEVL